MPRHNYSHTLDRTLYSLDGPRKIPDLDLGSFTSNNLYHRTHTQRFSHRIQGGHTRQQHFGIDIKVAQLDQSQAGLLHKLEQGLHLALTVDHAGEASEVNGAVDSGISCPFQ